MKTFLIRRLLAAIPLIVVVTFITKSMLVLSPGNYLYELRGRPGVSQDFIERMEKKYHLDSRNVFERYWYWLLPAMRGDLGYSFLKSASVVSLIGERVLNTLLLTGSALLFSWLLAVPLGVLAAVYRNRWADKLCSFVSFFGLSIPSVFFSLVMVLFAAKTGWFPPGGIHEQVMWDVMTPWQKFTDTVWHLVLPTVVLGTIGLATTYGRRARRASGGGASYSNTRSATRSIRSSRCSACRSDSCWPGRCSPSTSSHGRDSARSPTRR
jgi:peptide/nickel transport system permease protein